MSDLSRRSFLRNAAALSAVAATGPMLWADPPQGGQQDDRPNIIQFMSDDQGWGHTGYDGHPVIKTPNLDAMAANGLRLDRFYVACPKCSPCRYSTLTGLNPYRYKFFNGAHGGPFRKMKNPDRCIGEVAAEAGYLTAHFGKWHLGPLDLDAPTNPSRRGFGYWRTCRKVPEQDPIVSAEDGEQYHLKGNGSEAIVAEAITFIRKAVEAKRRFLVVIWTSDPHSAWRPPKEITKEFKYKGKRGAYFGEITAMDRALGQLRDALRELDQTENTMLWFNSDNGWGGDDRTPALRGGKTDCWEGGIRVPGVIEWPARIKAGSHSSVPVGTVDLMPTVGGLLGVKDLKLRVPTDGIDLGPLFDGKLQQRGKELPFSWTKSVGLMGDRYKILRGDPTNKADKPDEWHLYDIVEDPTESTNLVEKQPQLFAQKRKELETWIKSTAG